MIKHLKDTALVKKVGGKFRLTSLIQKRLRELMEGSRPLIEDTEGLTQLEIVIKEIIEDKIAVKQEKSASDELK